MPGNLGPWRSENGSSFGRGGPSGFRREPPSRSSVLVSLLPPETRGGRSLWAARPPERQRTSPRCLTTGIPATADPRHGRSAACGRTPRGSSVRPRGGPRAVLLAPRGRCARICLPGSPRGCEPPFLPIWRGIAQERPLAPRPCARFVVATRRSATPRSLAARREENALRDPAGGGATRSRVPCGHSPAARCAGRRGGDGPVRRLASAPAAVAG